MSRNFKLLRSNILLYVTPFTRNNFLNGITGPITSRFIYSSKSIGLDGYENLRSIIRSQFLNVENVFRSKMEEVCKEENSMIFTEDLKAMLHLAQKNSADVNLIIKMMQKFNMQNKELRFGTYIFGPVVMRTFYYLDEPDAALNAFKDPKLENFFDQIVSYQILMCLLYKHQKYAEIREVYEIIKTKHLDGNTHPRNPFVLLMAACYKENTPETFQYAIELWKDLYKKNYPFLRRSVTFIAALAINQNAPEATIEILATVKEPSYIDFRCLKVLAYSRLDRYAEIMSILQKSLDIDKPSIEKEKYFKDVIETLQQKLQTQDNELSKQLLEMIEQLKLHDQIMDMTLDTYITQEIRIRRTGFNKFISHHGIPTQNFQQRKRHGLRDLL